jgi:hypothetical protein
MTRTEFRREIAALGMDMTTFAAMSGYGFEAIRAMGRTTPVSMRAVAALHLLKRERQLRVRIESQRITIDALTAESARLRDDMEKILRRERRSLVSLAKETV